MNFNERDFCPYRVTRDTIQEPKFGAVIPLDQIPGEGICNLSNDRETPCLYPRSAELCPLKRNMDLCDKSWAKDAPDAQSF